jgi:hypothetical protein
MLVWLRSAVRLRLGCCAWSTRKLTTRDVGDGDGCMSTSMMPGRAEVAWVRALALGVGFSTQPDEVCLQELLTAARGSVTTLEQARETLPELGVIDAVARWRTCRFLELASRMARDRSGTT